MYHYHHYHYYHQTYHILYGDTPNMNQLINPNKPHTSPAPLVCLILDSFINTIIIHHHLSHYNIPHTSWHYYSASQLYQLFKSGQNDPKVNKYRDDVQRATIALAEQSLTDDGNLALYQAQLDVAECEFDAYLWKITVLATKGDKSEWTKASTASKKAEDKLTDAKVKSEILSPKPERMFFFPN